MDRGDGLGPIQINIDQFGPDQTRLDPDRVTGTKYNAVERGTDGSDGIGGTGGTRTIKKPILHASHNPPRCLGVVLDPGVVVVIRIAVC